MERQRFWGHNLNLLGSRGIIGHVTIGLAMYRFCRQSTMIRN